MNELKEIFILADVDKYARSRGAFSSLYLNLLCNFIASIYNIYASVWYFN